MTGVRVRGGKAWRGMARALGQQGMPWFGTGTGPAWHGMACEGMGRGAACEGMGRGAAWGGMGRHGMGTGATWHDMSSMAQHGCHARVQHAMAWTAMYAA